MRDPNDPQRSRGDAYAIADAAETPHERGPRVSMRRIWTAWSPSRKPIRSLVPQPGVVVAGEAAVRGAEQQFLDIVLPITLKARRVIVSGDIALLISDWTLTGKAAYGSDVNMSGTTADVARAGPRRVEVVIGQPTAFGTGH